MQKVAVLIGRFRRPVFAESLQAALSEYPELSVARVPGSAQLRAAIRTAGPKVLILDAAEPGVDVDTFGGAADVAVMLISDEGHKARIHLHRIDARRVRGIADILRNGGQTAADRLGFVRLRDLGAGVLRRIGAGLDRRHPAPLQAAR